MKRVPAYPSLSRGPRGSFEWAMDQLRAGNYVRREHWPIEVWPEPGGKNDPLGPYFTTRIWKLYSVDDATICMGFSSGVCGADNDSWGDLGTDSGCWTPKPDDMIALDWQLVSDVGPDQIEYLDAHRMTRHPNEAQATYREPQSPISALGIMFAIALAASIVSTAWWLSWW